MRAVFIHGPGDVRLEERSEPECGPDDVLIQVRACGVCGSDLAYIDRGQADFREIDGRITPIGHEAAGEVIAVGADVQGVRPGDRVAINPIDPGGRYSVGNGGPDGAFADLVLVRDVSLGGRLIPLLDGLGFDVAALAEPMGVALHAVNRSGAGPDSKVVVLGVGPIGLGVVIWLKHRGVKHVVAVDLSEERLERAKAFGADAVVVAGKDDLHARLGELHGVGRRNSVGTDIFIDAAGSPAALDEIVRIARFAAHLVVVAVYKGPVPVDLGAMLLKEMVLTTSMGYPAELPTVVEFLTAERERMAGFISARYPLGEFHDAVSAARDRASAKVMVVMEGAAR
jgi:(R,R)-butanediol dehydrogenase/meso-butanediol dehydrogenase/diacetyl reductase